MNNDEQLDYVSSAPSLIQDDVPKPIDEAEIAATQKAFELLEDRKKYYISVDALSLTDKTFTVEQQLAINKKVLFHIQEVQGLLSSVINKVREKQNGRQY